MSYNRHITNGMENEMKLSNTLQILSLAEKVVMVGEHSAETRIVLPRAALDLPQVVDRVSTAYAVLAV
jgi:hypothetical protein